MTQFVDILLDKLAVYINIEVVAIVDNGEDSLII